MLSASALDENAIDPTPLFDGLLSNVAQTTLIKSGFTVFTTSSEENLIRYLDHFCGLWQRVGDGFTPDVGEVRRQMDERETLLYGLWKLALEKDAPKSSIPDVVQAAIAKTANPLILPRQRIGNPLIVMSTGLWKMVCSCILGLLNWAEGDGIRENMGKQLFFSAIEDWLENSQNKSSTSMAIAEASTIDLEITHFAVGLANAAFTWAFFHEMGHFYLDHLPSSRIIKQMAADSSTHINVEQRQYSHQQELDADRFGYDRYLALMPHTLSIREKLSFGPQIDHAPIILLELIDMAYTLGKRPDLRNSSTHPPPLARVNALLDEIDTRLSDDGRMFYLYLHERLEAIGSEL